MALKWDFSRKLDQDATPGSTVSYFDEQCQSLYIQAGQIHTQAGQLHQGQWQDLIRDPEVTISDTGYSVLDIEHNFNGIVFGMAQHGSNIVFLIYEYMLDVSAWIKSGSWNLQPDNPIKIGSLSLLNVDSSRFSEDAHTLFAPGSVMHLRSSFGNSEPLYFAKFYIEDSPFGEGITATDFTFSGRNQLGFSLVNQTMDENTSYAGTKTDVVRALFNNAGVESKFTLIQEDTTVVGEYVFDPAENYFGSLQTALGLMGWFVDDTPEGIIIVGDAAFLKEHCAQTGIHTFQLGKDCFSRSVSRKTEGAYSRVCVRRQGEFPLMLYADVPYYEGWYIAPHKTFYQSVPDLATQEFMEVVIASLVEGMQYTGIVETFSCNFIPWLQVGDVATVLSNGVTRVSGIITGVKHSFGIAGCYTTIIVTSGGTISNPENPSTVVTKYANKLGGANRERRITDYLTNS